MCRSEKHILVGSCNNQDSHILAEHLFFTHFIRLHARVYLSFYSFSLKKKDDGEEKQGSLLHSVYPAKTQS